MSFLKLRGSNVDALIVLSIPILGVFTTISLQLTYLESILFFLGIPILYLAFKVPRTTLRKTGIFSLIFSLPLSVVVDYIITIDQGWFVPNSAFRLLGGVIPVEDLLFGFLSVWSITMIYEYFLDGKNKRICEEKIKYLVALIVGVVFVFSVIYLIFPTFLFIPYAFFIICSLSLLAPLIAILYYHPRLAKNTLSFLDTSFLFQYVGN